MMCGGLGDSKQADDDIHQIVQNLEPHVRTHAGDRKVEHVKAVSFRSQVVAGTNYFINVNLGGNDHAHLKVFKPLPHTGQPAQLVKAVFDKKHDDPIDFF